MSIIEQFRQISDERMGNLRHESHGNDEEEEDRDEKEFSFDKFIEKQGEQNIHHIIGLDFNDFNCLFRFLKSSLMKIGRGRKTLGEKEKLFVFLSWVSTGISFSKLSALLNISKSAIHRIAQDVTRRIKAKLVSKFIPISGDEARGYLTNRNFQNYPSAIGAIDSTIIRIRKPTDNIEQKKFYSGKHKTHCVKIQCIVNSDGICIHYSGLYPGKKHDIKIFEQSKAHDFFEFQKRLSNGVFNLIRPQLLADSGYQGSHRFYPEIIIPVKKTPGHDLTNDEKKHNSELSQDRIIVENFFGRMKSLFGITYQEFRGEFNFLNDIIPIVISLTNYHIHRHPLRKANSIQEDESDSDSFSDFNPEEERIESQSFNLSIE